MGISADSANVLLGRGKTFFDRWTGFDSGTATGLRFLGDVSKLEINTSDEKAKIYNYSVAAAPLLNEVVARREIEVTLTLHEFMQENLALVLMGEEAAYTQASGTVPDYLFSSIKRGRVYQVDDRNITITSVKKSPSTVLVAGNDYDVVDLKAGLIYVRPDASNIADGDDLLVSYSRAAIAAPGLARVRGGKTSQILGSLVFAADPGAGPAWDCEIWKLSISPGAAMGLITGQDFGSFDLKAQILSDEVGHPTEPYYRLTKRT